MGIISKIKEEVIKVKSNLTDKNYLIGIIIIILLEFSLIFFTNYIIIFGYNFAKDPNSINRDILSNVFYLVIMPLIIIFLLDKLGEIHKIEQLKNRFIHLSIFIALLTIFGSNSIISAFYEPQFPITFLPNKFNNVSCSVVCYSLKSEFKNVVKNQFLDCYATIDFQKNISNVSFLGVDSEIIYYINNSNIKGIKSLGYVQVDRINTSFIIKSIRLKLEEVGPVDLQFIFRFNEEENKISYRSNLNGFNVMNYEDNERRRSEELQYRIAALGIALTASFVGVKNFMDIWDRKSKENNTNKFDDVQFDY